jgi:hypothetical protein
MRPDVARTSEHLGPKKGCCIGADALGRYFDRI